MSDTLDHAVMALTQMSKEQETTRAFIGIVIPDAGDPKLIVAGNKHVTQRELAGIADLARHMLQTGQLVNQASMVAEGNGEEPAVG